MLNGSDVRGTLDLHRTNIWTESKFSKRKKTIVYIDDWIMLEQSTTQRGV